MEENKFKSNIPVIIATIILIASVSLTLLKPDKAPNWIEGFNAILVAIIAYSQFIYTHSKEFFILVNKMIAWFKGDTVSWSSSYKFSFHAEDSYRFQEDIEGFRNRLKDSFKDAKLSRVSINENSAYMNMDYLGYTRTLEIHLDLKEQNISQIKFFYKCSLSYKDSKSEIKRFSEVLDLISKNHKVISSDSANHPSQLELYSIKMSFSRFNPFYKLSVKNISNIKDVRFRLTFVEDDTTIKITNNSLSAISKNKNNLFNVLKDYVALSNIG